MALTVTNTDMDDNTQDLPEVTPDMEETGAVVPEHTPGHTSSGDEADVAAVDEDEEPAVTSDDAEVAA